MARNLAQSFLLVPCTKDETSIDRKAVWANGSVACFHGDGSISIATDATARRLVNILDGDDHPHILDAVLVEALEAVFLTVKGFSGVYACAKGSTRCLPLKCGRLLSGLRTAQPMKAPFGPMASSLIFDDTQQLLCAGDSRGAIAVWDLGAGTIDSPPKVVFGAHGQSGMVRSMKMLEGGLKTFLVSASDREIKLWEIEDVVEGMTDEERTRSLPVRCLRTLVWDGETWGNMSTSVCGWFSCDGEVVAIAMGSSRGLLLLWQVPAVIVIDDNDGDYQSLDDDKHFSAMVIRAVPDADGDDDSIVFIASIQDSSRLIVNSRRGQIIVFDMEGSKLRIDTVVQLNEPVIGVFSDGLLVVDEFSSLSLTDLQELESEQRQQRQPDVQEQHTMVDMNKAIAYIMNTRAVNSIATRAALDRPRSDQTTFDENVLIPVSPTSLHPRNKRRRGRQCLCCNHPDENHSSKPAIWVKRRVPAPKVDPLKRKPLYQSSSGAGTAMRADGTIVSALTGLPNKPLPPFVCRRLPESSKGSKEEEDAGRDVYLRERNGQIFCGRVESII